MIFNFSNRVKNYLFRNKIKNKNLDTPKIILSDNWNGDPVTGELLINSKNPLKIIQNVDSFDFLRDLKSCGFLKTRPIARKIIDDWIDYNTDFFSSPFKVDIMAHRISVMCMTYSWYANSGELNFQKKVLKSIYTQVKLLEMKLENSIG